MAKAAVLSILLSILGTLVLFAVCSLLGMLGAGRTGFWILMGPGYAFGPLFSFLTSLLPASVVHALVGTSSVGSSLGLLALWSLVFWLVLFWVVAFVILRVRGARRHP